MKKKAKSKSRSPVVHAYQSNPYALQRRNAPAAPPELVPVIVQPSRRRRVARVARRVKERATDRLSSNQFLAEAGITAASAGVAALATGWLAGKGVNPWAVGIGTAVVGAAGALVAPGAWRGAGLGISGWGVGQVVATAMQQHAVNEFKRQKKIEEQKALEQQQKLEQAAGQKALPAPAKPSNAFMPAISDAFANSRTYGHYGRADDEERYLDLDLVLR
jgi:hypothetical protein